MDMQLLGQREPMRTDAVQISLCFGRQDNLGSEAR
jgi:hypothetical protein